MTELEKEILNKIIKLEHENRDRLYKETSTSKTKVKKKILEIIERYSEKYYEESNL